MEQANLKSYTRIWVGRSRSRSRRHPRHARPEISHPGPPAPRVPTPKTHTHTTHLASSQKISGRLGFRCACAHRKTRPPSPPPPASLGAAAAAAARRACSPKCREAAGIGEPMVAVARGRRCRGVVLLLLLSSVLAPLVLYGGSPVSVSTLPDSTGTNGRMPPPPSLSSPTMWGDPCLTGGVFVFPSLLQWRAACWIGMASTIWWWLPPTSPSPKVGVPSAVYHFAFFVLSSSADLHSHCLSHIVEEMVGRVRFCSRFLLRLNCRLL